MPERSKGQIASASMVCAGCALMAYAVRGRSSQLFGPSVYRGSKTRRSIALTFDDGPSESTPRLLEVLGNEHLPASFFQCGRNVERLPQVAREVHAAGHEIGNHSDTHPAFYFRSAQFIENEFTRAQQAIQVATGVAPSLLRSPFGVRWFGFRRMQRRLNLLGVMWTVIGRDWELSARAVVNRIVRRLQNGAIICLHDGRGTKSNPDIQTTVAAVRELIPRIQALGFRFETVSQLLCPTN